MSGYLNVGYCKVCMLNHKPLDLSAPDLFFSYGFNQLIDIPTRVTENTISLLSPIYANQSEDVLCHY